jgi:hypothetical protein
MDDPLGKHYVVQGLIEELQKMKPSDACYDTKFAVLAKRVNQEARDEAALCFSGGPSERQGYLEAPERNLYKMD